MYFAFLFTYRYDQGNTFKDITEILLSPARRKGNTLQQESAKASCSGR